MRKMVCENWLYHNEGECRRHAPLIKMVTREGKKYPHQCFPPVFVEDWCGDWEEVGNA